MVTVHRAHGMTVVIFLNDHEPAHVHVFGDGHAKINLAGRDGAGVGLGRGDDAWRGSPLYKDGYRAARPFADEVERNSWLI